MSDLREVASGFSYLESPRWHDGRLWTSDFYTHRVLAIDPSSGRTETIVQVEGQPSGLGWMPDGTLLIASMTDRRVLRFAGGDLDLHADLTDVTGGPVNDLVVDEAGRAWVGNFGFDLTAGHAPQPTCLVRVEPDGAISVAAEGLSFPNGAVIGDGTLVVAETVGQRLTAFDLGQEGLLTNRRTWVDFGAAEVLARTGNPVLPDGITLDAEGCIWVADALSGRVVRMAEDGTVRDEIGVGTGTFACMLGGPDGRTLFICAAPSYLEHERRHTRDSVLLAVDVAVPHAGLP